MLLVTKVYLSSLASRLQLFEDSLKDSETLLQQCKVGLHAHVAKAELWSAAAYHSGL